MIESGARRGMSVRAGGFLAPLALFVLPAIAQDASVSVITTTIASSGAHKECLSLSKTQRLRYWFRADAAIDFSIQYQDAGGVVHTVKREKRSILCVSRERGSLLTAGWPKHCGLPKSSCLGRRE